MTNNILTVPDHPIVDIFLMAYKQTAFGLAFFVERFLLTVILYISITFLYLIEMAKDFDMCPKRKNPHEKKNFKMTQH
jgi:hypothetical protein